MKRRGMSIFIVVVSSLWLLDTSPLWSAQGVVSKESVTGSSYCRLRFPAIREETLFSSRPQLKDPMDGDLIDFYGPCDYDPLGIEQVRRQRADVRRDRRNDNDSD
jgi:hypothetical protein